MENLNTYNSHVYHADSLHSQICLADSIDFIYRKAYKGDWGHWDDLPDNSTLNLNCADTVTVKSENSIGRSEVPNENSYL